MIFTEKKITINNNQCKIDSPVVLYRGDYNVEVRFTIVSSPYKYGNRQETNLIESTEASYGQLVIQTPDTTPIFSEVTATKEGAVIFTITAEMIDEITEIGNYTFQIRLLDENKESRATLPEVVNGIEIREPIATEDITDTNEVGVATAGYALTTAGTTEDAFDSQGNYNKTTWETGDRITAEKLNKIEQGITGVNKKVPHYNETLMFEISGDNYNSFTNNSYFNMSALNIDETKSYVGEERYGEYSEYDLYVYSFVYDKENGALIDENSQTYIYNHKSYDGTNFVEDTNSAVLTYGITLMSTGLEGEGYFKLYEIDKVGLDNNCLSNNVSIKNSLTVGSRIGSVGECSVSEGVNTTASGDCSHAEGYNTTASSDFSHAEGMTTTASGKVSHAEGKGTETSGVASHAEGIETTASGGASHAEGRNTIASGMGSHAEGDSTKATSDFQHVQGKYNINDTANKYAHIVGNGTSDNARSNAHTLDWQGNGWYKGKLSQDGTPTEDKDLATKKYVDDVIENIEITSGGGSNINDTTASATTTYSSNKIESIKENLSSQIEAIGGGTTGTSKYEPEELDMPKVFFYGTTLPTSKTDVNLTMDYISNTTKFSSYIKLKCQGNSSMSYAKKNFTINMYSDEARETKLKKDFKGWGAQSKFCLKANYIDTTHTRNLSGARIAYDMVASRPDSEFKQQLLQCPRNGAVDGFPIKLYFNGEFYGIYTWNIPKDGWMFNMDESNPNHMVLCAEQNNNGSSTSDNNTLICEFRKEWDGGGNSWSIEFGTLSDALKNSFNRCINFVMTATDEEFKANIGNYFDLYSLLDYYCFSYLVAHIDGLGKNMLMATYDGAIWGATLYDMDSIYGGDWNGASFKAADIQCPEQYQETNSLLWQRIESCFSAELYARYLELRQGALSLSNIIKHVEEIYDVIPDRVFADERAKWTSLPVVTTNTMTRFRNYMRDRAKYVDTEMKEMKAKVPCTGIVLSTDTLSFTTADTQTLEAVVSPSDTTDTIVWSAEPAGIVTVDNGVVTPLANGEAVITATCGSYSDTCSVTVSLAGVACTGITLDNQQLNLGSISVDYSGAYGVNLLEGITWEKGNISNTGDVGTTGTDYHSQLIEIPAPGIYTYSSTNGYTYKKYFTYGSSNKLTSRNIGANDSNDVEFLVLEPCTIRLTMFPNSLAVDNSTISLVGRQLELSYSDIEKDVQLTLGESNINVKFVGTEYSLVEIYTDKLYPNMIACNYMNTNYKCVESAVVGSNAGGLTEVLNAQNEGFVHKYEYNNKTYILAAIPIIYGTTAAEICNHISTMVVNPSNIVGDILLNRKTVIQATLNATVTPVNCTQPVVWSVSPEGIVTVDNGLVTAVTNGETTVTATCGTQSATCNVTVSGMSG